MIITSYTANIVSCQEILELKPISNMNLLKQKALNARHVQIWHLFPRQVSKSCFNPRHYRFVRLVFWIHFETWMMHLGVLYCLFTDSFFLLFQLLKRCLLLRHDLHMMPRHHFYSVVLLNVPDWPICACPCNAGFTVF